MTEHTVSCEVCSSLLTFEVVDDEQDAFLQAELAGWVADGTGKTWCPGHQEEREAEEG